MSRRFEGRRRKKQYSSKGKNAKGNDFDKYINVPSKWLFLSLFLFCFRYEILILIDRHIYYILIYFRGVIKGNGKICSTLFGAD